MKIDLDKKILLVCDTDQIINTSYDVVAYWGVYTEDKDRYSIPRIVEDNADELKNEYLQFLYHLGNKKHKGKSLKEHLAIREDFSLWWMSLLVEKSQWKSPHLYTVFRVLALQRLVQETKVNEIKLYGLEKIVAEVIQLFCERLDIKVTVLKVAERCKESSIVSLYNKLPHVLQAIIYFFRYMILRWPFKKSHTAKFVSGNSGTVAFFSYFTNVDLSAAENNQFRSGFWTDLHDVLKQNNICSIWLHMYVKSNTVPNRKNAFQLIKKFNVNNESQLHNLLDSYINTRLIFSVLRDYCKLIIHTNPLRNRKVFFLLAGSNINLWPILKRDYKCSLFGKTAMFNIIMLNLFESYAKKIPKQQLGLYLQENQGWERSLIYAWRKMGHGEIIGVPHTVVSEWDLRHYSDPLEYVTKDMLQLPIPDRVALNGMAAFDSYRKSGFPSEKLLKVEALRYLYLNKYAAKKNIGNGVTGSLRLLVLGDYLSDVTRDQLQLLSDAYQHFPKGTKLLVKSHPANPIIPTDWPSLSFQNLDKPMDELEGLYDVAFTSNPTSAAVDAFLAGKPVLTMLDATSFNMSPLRGKTGVYFVATAHELSHLLSGNLIPPLCSQNDFFNTDPMLPLWSDVVINNKESN